MGMGDHRYGCFQFGASCSGTCAFRHNLSIPLGPGSLYQIKISKLLGDWYVSAIDANTFTVTATSTAWNGKFEVLENVGDYNA